MRSPRPGSTGSDLAEELVENAVASHVALSRDGLAEQEVQDAVDGSAGEPEQNELERVAHHRDDEDATVDSRGLKSEVAAEATGDGTTDHAGDDAAPGVLHQERDDVLLDLSLIHI